MATDDDIPSFDEMPSFDKMQSEAPQQQAQRPLMFDDLPSFDDMPESQGSTTSESGLKTFGREAAHAAIPAAGGMAGAGAGALAGAEVGTAVLPGWGTLAGGIVGGLAGMIGGSTATEKAQDYGLEQLGFDDAKQRAANAQEHPYAAFAGGMAPAVATMSPVRGAQVAQRALGAGMMGGFEAGQELYQGNGVDPIKVVAATALGAAMPKANRVGDKLFGIAGKVAGRPAAEPNPASGPAKDEVTSSQQPAVTGESSLQQSAPTASGDTTGNPQSAPTRSARTYPKGEKPSQSAGTDPLTQGTFSPDVAEALRVSTEQNAIREPELPEIPPPAPEKTGVGSLVENPDQVTAAGSGMLNPGEQLPIKTGFPEPAPEVAPAPVPPAAQAAITKSKLKPLYRNGKKVGGANPDLYKPQEGESFEQHPPIETSEPIPAFDDIPDHPATLIDRNKVNVNPSDAQKEAGNYEKAPVRVFNREAKIETPEGATRRSKSTDPVQWENVSPYDYGHILRTVGADGDPIDVAIGKGDRHFIIDQRDPETGKFDEHKVFSHFNDVTDAASMYEKGFSDNKGAERMQAITEVTPKEARAWMDDLKKNPEKRQIPYAEYAGKETTEPSEGTKPMPKIVTAAVTKMKERGLPQEAIDRFMALEPSDRLGEANKFVNESDKVAARPDRIRGQAPVVEGLTNDAGEPITARDKADAARKSADVKTMNDAYEKIGDVAIPTTSEEKADLRGRLEAFMNDTQNVKYRPAVKHAPYLMARAARKLLLAKNPSEKSWTEFASTAKQLAEGGAKDVRQTQRIESDIGMSRRSGDEAVANAEAARASQNDVEDQMLSEIDRKRALEEKGEFDIHPAEDVEGIPEPVKTAADVKKFDVKQGKLDLSKPEDRAKLQSDTAKLADNLVREANRQAPVKESEGAASAVRKVDPSKVDMDEIMARFNKANAKSKAETGAIREEELGKFSPEPQARDKLAAFWNNESGALDFDKVTKDFRALARRPLKFYTKILGGLTNDRLRRADAVLAQALSTEDSKLAEKAHQLFDARYYQWLDQASKPEMMTYLKVIEKPENDTVPKLRQALLDAGLPAKKVDWMVDEATFHRDLMDKIWRDDAAHGAQSGYVKNYVAHIFKDEAGAEKFIDDRIHALGPTWYQKERMFDLMDQAIKAGFKPKFTNPIDLVNARWAASIRANGIVSAARALQKQGLAFPIKDAPEGASKQWAYKRQLPDRNQWVFSPDAAMLWENSIEPKGLNENQGVPGSIYRTWMGVKNVMVPVQLMLSAFHELHVAGNIMPAQALHQAFIDRKGGQSFVKAYGAALKNIGGDAIFALPLDKVPYVGQYLDRNGSFSNYTGRRIQDIWRMPDEQLSPGELITKRLFQEAGVSPYQSREDVIGAKRKFAEAIADLRNEPGLKKIPPVAWRGISRGIEKLQEPMFKYQIPSLKNAALLRAMTSAIQQRPELASNETLRGQVFRELGKDIDDRFGEMFYKGLFWNKTLKDVGVGSMLSLSWNLGQLRQVAGAAAQTTRMLENALGKQRSSIEEARNTASNKLSFVTHYVGLSMLSAGALSWALSGQLPSGLDYIFPRSGALDPETGHPQRLTSPFNTREAVMLKAHADEHNSWLGGAMQLLWNKMVLQPIVELATNKDFFGRALYDTNAPWYKEAAQAVDSTLGRTLSPIALSGADRAKQQGTGMKGQILSYAGFGPGPKYVNETPLERRINYLSHQYAPASRPYEYGPQTGLGRGLVQGAIRGIAGDELKSEARTTARNAMFQAHAIGDQTAELAARKKMVEKGELSPRIVNKIQPGRQAEGEYARLPKEEQLSLAKTMSD